MNGGKVIWKDVLLGLLRMILSLGMFIICMKGVSIGFESSLYDRIAPLILSYLPLTWAYDGFKQYEKGMNLPKEVENGES